MENQVSDTESVNSSMSSSTSSCIERLKVPTGAVPEQRAKFESILGL